MATVRLHQVSKRYGEVAAVEDISLTIADGEFVTLVGPSGCGKSTTLRMIAGLEAATEGEIWIGDQLANDIHPADRDVAMVFQSYALYPHMSVYDNIAYGLKRRGYPGREIGARVEEVANLLQLGALLGRRPAQLSGGQRQRVALGRAIVRRPAVFLMDEPLSNLDAQLRVGMRAELLRLHAKLGTTTVYVTHDQIEAMTLAERVVVMNGGRIEQLGPPLDLYQMPETVFVARFLGMPPMNFLRGALVRTATGAKFASQHRTFEVPGMTIAEDLPAAFAAIRPQRLAAGGGQTADRVSLGTATVDFVEHYGADSFATVSADGETLSVAVTPGARIVPGSTIDLSAAAGDILFFDQRTGQRLDLTVTAAPAAQPLTHA